MARPSQPGGGIKRILQSGARAGLAGLLIILLCILLAANTAGAFNTYRDIFVTLSARPLALGGAGGAMSSAACVFYNPAGLADLRRFTLLYNHSARHFPGSRQGKGREMDQLDGDTEAIVVPLPIATYAHGFTFSGEMGYDYRNHPADGSLGYPRERYWGSEDYDALACPTGLPLRVGVALRRSFGAFTPAPEDRTPAWTRVGEGTQWGILARPWPGLDYGQSRLRLDYDWLVAGEQPGAPLQNMSSKLKLRRESWALHPTGWLTLYWDGVTETHVFDSSSDYGLSNPVGRGTIHLGNQTFNRIYRGQELNLANLVMLRSGNYDGNDTLGVGVNLGGLWLNYAEAQGLLPLIVGRGDRFTDVHIYGFEWTW